jgi:GMP synthase (glutamine-hydrolysing)
VKTLLAIRHVPFEDLGSFALLLAQSGYAIRYVDAPTADFMQLEKLPQDLLVVLGGPIGVNDGADYPFIAPELKFIEARLKRDLPTLGICLGAQFMAKALGARVYKGTGAEIGWKPLSFSDSGQTSPLRHLDGPVFHWHGEVFDLPAGAVNLAATDLAPCQAFACGNTALALQFHPEVTARGLEQWYVAHTGELRGQAIHPEDLRRASQRLAPALESRAAAFLVDWIERL